MKKIIVLTFCVLLFASTQAQNVNKAIYTDIEKTEEFPAGNVYIPTQIASSSIAVYALLAGDSTKKQTVIFCHGMPGFEKNLDLAQVIRRSGRNAVYFNYRGSWGSEGEYLYANSLEDVNALIDHLSKPEISERYRIDTTSFVLFGHSYGGGIALLSGANNEQVDKIIAMSPMNLGYWLKNASAEDKQAVLEGVNRNFMLNVSPNLVQDIEGNVENYDVINYQIELSKKSVLVLDENDRNREWVEKIPGVDYLIWDTDHSFTHKRIELANTILIWLENN